MQRALTEAERTELQERLSSLPTSPARIRQAITNYLVVWAGTLLVSVIIWGLVASIATRIIHIDFGWRSPSALAIVSVGTVACGAYAAFATVQWMRAWQDFRPLYRRDLHDGMALEEFLDVTAVKRFQEPEHGGLIYFLRTHDDRVFVLYDAESQDRGVRGENPLGSSFRPHARLQLVRAPVSRYVFRTAFSGPPLQLEDPRPLAIAPRDWPESEEFCAIAWNDLDVRLGSRATVASVRR